MILVCPQCDTSFALPDELYRPGRKARCSNCANVFAMPEMASKEPAPQIDQHHFESPPAQAAQPVASKKRVSLVLMAVLVVCLIGIALGGYMVFRSLSSSKPSVSDPKTIPPSGKAVRQPTPEELRQAEIQAERVKDIVLDDVRQFVINNDKLGHIVVIQGKAVNNFTTPKEMIVVEAHLLDDKGNILAVQQQRAGVSLTLMQLQILDAKEMQAALNNTVEILLNNTNVPTKGEVPFFIVFPKQPDNMYEFEVRPIDARDPPVKK